MPKSPLKRFLEALKQQQLLKLADLAEVKLTTRRDLAPIIDALWNNKARLVPVLRPFLEKGVSIQELRVLCERLGLGGAGVAKGPYVELLLSNVSIPSATEDDGNVSTAPSSNAKVFIVHGHDEAMRASVEHVLDRFGVTPIVLMYEANRGQTVIEKLEQNIADCHCAIVLLSPDDVGSKKGDESKALGRARQNVIFEFGLVYGMLGRQKVIALKKGDVDFPTDIYGVVWVGYSDGDKHGLAANLARELKVLGYNVDLNRML